MAACATFAALLASIGAAQYRSPTLWNCTRSLTHINDVHSDVLNNTYGNAPTLLEVGAFAPSDFLRFVRGDLRGPVWKMFLAPFLHNGVLHLLFNLSALVSINDVNGGSPAAVAAERSCGTSFWVRYTLLMLPLTGLIHCGLAVLQERLARVSNRSQWIAVASMLNDQRAVGFSAVLFAWMTVVELLQAGDSSVISFLGVRLPFSFSPFLSMILVQVLVRNASFIGHLSGIVLGYLLSIMWAFEAAAADNELPGRVLHATSASCPRSLLVSNGVVMIVCFWCLVLIVVSLKFSSHVRLRWLEVESAIPVQRSSRGEHSTSNSADYTRVVLMNGSVVRA